MVDCASRVMPDWMHVAILSFMLMGDTIRQTRQELTAFGSMPLLQWGDCCLNGCYVSVAQYCGKGSPQRHMFVAYSHV